MPLGVAPEQIVPKSLGGYLEIPTKAVFQSGMSWKVVESKCPTIREAFNEFQIGAVAAMDESAVDALTDDRRVIRNRRKLQAITDNARKMIELDEEYGSFQKYLRSHDSFWGLVKDLRSSSNSWVRWAATTGYTLWVRTFLITMCSRPSGRRRNN